MNLAKKGSVVLTVLSVFALASCNNSNKEGDLTVGEAYQWIKENYIFTKQRAKVTKSRYEWDYSKNVKKETIPSDDPEIPEELKGQDVNSLCKYALKEQFKIESDDAKGTKDQEGWAFVNAQPLNEANFRSLIAFFDTTAMEIKITLKNKALSIAMTKDWDLTEDMGLPIVIKTTQISHYDTFGYMASAEMIFDQKDATVKLSDTKSFNLGDVKFNFYETPIEFEQVE